MAACSAQRRRLLAGALAGTAATIFPPVRDATASPASAGRGAQTDDRAPAIAAASDLKFALEEIATDFTRETGRALRLSFGSSGNFARQIEQGAPFELFLSADEDMIFRLVQRGLTQGEGRLYAIGRLALAVPPGSPLAPDPTLRDLAAALADGRLKRFAIANPDHAPYGKRAEEALRHAGLWEAIRPRLVLGENVSQAAQFALSGSAQGGLIAQSLASSSQLAGRLRSALIDEGWHRPLRQRMALMRGAGDTARRFHDRLASPAAREVFERHGFSTDVSECGARPAGA
jgi:molybdate transport system substrate-binding protein